jgi:hypothetical protein
VKHFKRILAGLFDKFSTSLMMSARVFFLKIADRAEESQVLAS